MTTPVCVLVGPPGAGKSTVGRLVAQRLGVGLRDTDLDVEAAAGMTVADVFLTEGEERFRALEAAAVAQALAEHEGVLALGGGAVLDPATRAVLAGHAVVWLDASLTATAARVGLNRDRPLLLGDTRARLRALMDARRPLYDEVASSRIDTSDLSAEQVADAVLLTLAPRGVR